jgi:methyl-accepting chemotaxis protein
MRFITTLKRSVALLGASGLVAAALIAAQSQWTHRAASDAAGNVFFAKDVVADILPPPMYLIELRLILSQAVEGSIDPPQARREHTRLSDEYAARVKYWEAQPAGALTRLLLGAQHDTATQFIDAAGAKVIEPLTAGDREAARAALAGVHALYLAHRADVDTTVKASSVFAAESEKTFLSLQSTSQGFALGALMLSVTLVLLISRMTLRSIDRPVERCAALARRIAEGDLGLHGPVHTSVRRDSVGALEGTLEIMRGKLSELVGEVRRNAVEVASAADQINVGHDTLSERTVAQADALHETAATMSRLTSTVESNAGSAREADALARQAADVATRGGRMVSEVVDTIQDISASGRSIGEIIGVIDGIAFQTNILALNAAVEAARAGEQGRGFAVVASEVRALAHRSSQAAREVKGLIERNGASVEKGTSLVEQSGHTMDEIVGSIKQLSGAVSEIAMATGQQGESIGQAGVAIERMEDGTRMNAALVEEGHAASGALRQQAERLVAAVSAFKT